MKTILQKFSDNLLSREQMKSIIGGVGDKCPNGVTYETEQLCKNKCKAGTYATCSVNKARSVNPWDCACID